MGSDPLSDETAARSVPLEIADAAFATRTNPGAGAGTGTSTTCGCPLRSTTCFTAGAYRAAKSAPGPSMLARMPRRQKVLSVVGTRPNLMKTAPVVAALVQRQGEFEQVLVHTGQHYDYEMFRIFIEELGLGEPDFVLDVGSGSHAEQTARVLERLEPVLVETAPDVVLVPGDVNSTMAAAIAAAKLGIPVGHIEAGLRSFDRTMPEELNRVIADALADLLFIHSPEARDNLLAEGRPEGGIHYVGNTMIDTLVAMRERIESLDAPGRYGLSRGGYLAVTLHRPALVDGPLLDTALRELEAISSELEVVFPVHPRTRAAIEANGFEVGSSGFRLLEPLGYLEFLSLVDGAAAVLTDSGGIQEETTFLGIPCFTLRSNTERPITVELGTNTLLGLEPGRIADVPRLIDGARGRPSQMPPLWDGKAADRIADVLARGEHDLALGLA
jgi:UDP-N-acetylglucosamine 2-epimerase (non-hydrolysing)